MALSNWDTLALDKDGQPCNGVLLRKFKDGSYSAVEIYKNWLYVRDTTMWSKNKNFIEPTIAQISEGEIFISDYNIHAIRGPQISVLAYIETGYKNDNSFDCMCGIGCCGFDNEDWIGVRQETFNKLIEYLEHLSEDYIVEKDYIKTIKDSVPLRFNQGDGYFAEKFNKEELTQVTEIGKAEKPVMIQMIGDKNDVQQKNN